MEEISGIENTAEYDRLYLNLTNQIWKCITKKHPLYNFEDIGWEESDPVTVKDCIKAQEILDELYVLGLLAPILTVLPENDGQFAFEWYAGRNYECGLCFNYRKYDGEDKLIFFFRLGLDEGESSRFMKIAKISEVLHIVKNVIEYSETAKTASGAFR